MSLFNKSLVVGSRRYGKISTCNVKPIFCPHASEYSPSNRHPSCGGQENDIRCQEWINLLLVFQELGGEDD